jgi:hypothetical protein
MIEKEIEVSKPCEEREKEREREREREKWRT